ncbi:hypothetical protein DERP_001588 [Dermatophagoides pteronyssinus]|uniref:Uncharacterized protein n=1 Tax=Dermatophagoides pteronyssinus TaxID=6956 RepID=A0ABQ8JBJ4_DERPT|nr:hypothetical protein DERP_001588 [Dermatophagoides pteronyssinus]
MFIKVSNNIKNILKVNEKKSVWKNITHRQQHYIYSKMLTTIIHYTVEIYIDYFESMNEWIDPKTTTTTTNDFGTLDTYPGGNV